MKQVKKKMHNSSNFDVKQHLQEANLTLAGKAHELFWETLTRSTTLILPQITSNLKNKPRFYHIDLLMRNQIYCALQMRLQKVCQSHTEIIFQACTYYCRLNSIWLIYNHRLIHYKHVICGQHLAHEWRTIMHFLQLLCSSSTYQSET